MKKILFDLSVCQPLGSSKFHGGGVYGYIVFKALVNYDSSQIIVYYDKSRYLPDDIEDIIRAKNIPIRHTNKNSILDLYKNNEFEKLYTPLWSDSYFSLFEYNVPIILTQHGLRSLEMNRDKYEYMYASNFKEFCKSIIKQTPLFKLLHKRYYKSYRRMFMYHNLSIITVSEHSKASIMYYYPFINKDQIKVFYSPNTSEQVSTDNIQTDKYYLLISANRWLKNCYRALLAFDKLFDANNVAGKVVITGVSKHSKLLSKLKHKDRFITRNYLERDDLESLYRNAYALIYPSLNEGFGYPPIEAMKYGIPVISSSFASISEICADAPLYVNPYSVDEISMRIIELEGPDTYEKVKNRSYKRYEIVKSKQDSDLQELVKFILK